MLILSIIFCSFSSIFSFVTFCFNETNVTQCQRESKEEEGISCRKVRYFFRNGKEDEMCGIYFNNETLQKIYRNYRIGDIYKETFSVFELSYMSGFSLWDFDNDTYRKDETIRLREYNFLDVLTEDEKKIIASNNTCYHRQLEHDMDSDKFINNSLDKNVCFNVNRFEELKDILDCGYFIIRIFYKNKLYEHNNCYKIPDANMDEKFKKLFLKYYYTESVKDYIDVVIDSFVKNYVEKDELYKSNKRQLEDSLEYEIYIEDKYGNKKKYNKNGEEISDNNVDEPSKFINTNCSNYSFNIIILLFYILLIL